jgi:tRNA A-37 threonylcarbamoyl transferase component Bud32
VNDPRWERIKSVFGAAMEIPAARWPAFLDAECAGDAEVRREVESLLASQSEGVFKTAGGLEAVARVNADAAHREVAADGPAQSSEAHALSQKEEAAQRVEEVRRARASGTTIDDDAILRLFPHLADELRPALNELRRDEVSRTPVIAPPAPGGRARQPQATGYSIIRELGRGGQAVVYLALQLSTGQRVALKVMRDGHLADERALKRFLREVQVLAELNHPCIVTIIDTGQTSEGSQFLAMKYIPGATLARHLADPQFDDPADPARLLRLFLKICDALNEAHQRGIVHRDLKPSNILIDERGDPHILDFGIARMPLDRVDMHDGEPVSIHGEFLGSLPWSSPEQAEGSPDKIDPRSDVYSLGVILYQMLTGGRFPYEVVGNMRDVLNNIMSVEPTPPSRLISTQLAKEAVHRRGPVRRPSLIVNESIEKVVLKALAKKPESRYQTAGEFGRAIERYLAGQPMGVAGNDGVAARRLAWRGARRTSIVVGIVAVLVGVGFLMVRWMRPDGASHEKVDSSSAKQEPSAANTPPIAAGTTSSLGADLLKRVNLSNDVVSGDWTAGDFGLRCELAAPANIRFGRAIEGDYKYEVVFTATSGDEGVGLVMTRDGKSFVWFMGSEEGRVYGFQRLDARSMSLQTGAPDTPNLTNDERHIATVEVRADSVQAYLDGKLVTSLAAGHEFGELWSGWRIGPNSLGITTYRQIARWSERDIDDRRPNPVASRAGVRERTLGTRGRPAGPDGGRVAAIDGAVRRSGVEQL